MDQKIPQRSVTVAASVRPIRYAWIVQNQEALYEAIRFLSHTWGGGTSFIFPVPETPYHLQLLQEGLAEVEPDLIMYFSGGMNEGLQELLSPYEGSRWPITSSDEVRKFAEKEQSFIYHRRVLPHMVDLVDGLELFPSLAVAMDEASPWRIGLAAQAGILSPAYSQVLHRHGMARIINPITVTEEYIRASIACAAHCTLRRLTRASLKGTYPVRDDEVDDHGVLNLYLYKPDELHVTCSYWNMSGAWPKNKLLVPMEMVQESASVVVQTLLEAFVTPFRLLVHTRASETEATGLRDLLRQEFLRQTEESIPIQVLYDIDGYDTTLLELIWETPLQRPIVPLRDDLYEVKPPVPTPLQGTAGAFAVDLSFLRPSGREYTLPPTVEAARIVTYGPDRIEMFNSDYRSLRQRFSFPRVLPSKEGMRVISAERLKDKRHAQTVVAIPSDERFVMAYVAQYGYRLRPNEAAHFARSFVRRYDLQDSQSIIAIKDDIEIAGMLLHRYGEYKTFHANTLNKKLSKQRSLSDKDKSVEGIINASLLRLITNGIVQRVIPVKCVHCEYTDRHLLKEIGEMVECSGCGSRTVVGVKLNPEYRLTDLGVRLLGSGGGAVVKTLLAFHRMENPGMVTIGGELVPHRGQESIVDFDVIQLSREEVVVAECKGIANMRDNTLPDIVKGAKQVIDKAGLIRATVAYLCVYTTNDIKVEPIRAELERIGESVQSLEFRFIIDDCLYWFRNENGARTLQSIDIATERWSVTSSSVREWPKHIGDSLREDGGHDHEAMYRKEVIEQYVAALSATPASL